MESVLVVKTDKLRDYIGGRNGLICDRQQEMLAIITQEHEFIPRDKAEEDPSYKQIIPYVVLTRGEQIFTTRRLNKGGEARLHGKISIGIGGHINPIDEKDRQKVLLCGLERELFEEVDIEKRGELIPCGFINDDSTVVGNVHLGMCFRMEVSGEVKVKETEKLLGGWMTREELKAQYDSSETWTQIAENLL